MYRPRVDRISEHGVRQGGSAPGGGVYSRGRGSAPGGVSALWGGGGGIPACTEADPLLTE